MSTVTASGARARFGELLERVSRGEEVVVARRDKVVARPCRRARRDWTRFVAPSPASSRLQARIRRRTRATLSDREVRSAVEKGRS